MIDFEELFQREDVKPRHLDDLIDFLADYSCENKLAQTVWEALVEVRLASKGDVDQINLNRSERSELNEYIKEMEAV